jgi:hypothetical protein
MFRRRAFTYHHVGDSRLAPVNGRKSVSKTVGNTNCLIESDSLLPIGNAIDPKISAKVAYLGVT